MAVETGFFLSLFQRCLAGRQCFQPLGQCPGIHHRSAEDDFQILKTRVRFDLFREI